MMKCCCNKMRLFCNHWHMQRFTNLLLLPLSFWLVISLVKMSAGGIGHIELIRFLSEPFNQYMLIGFVGVMAYHCYLGMYEVFKDYMTCPVGQKITFTILKIIAIALTAVSAYIILKINGA